MALKKLRFELVDNVKSHTEIWFQEYGGNVPIHGLKDENLLAIMKNGNPRDSDIARKELIHRRSRYRRRDPTDQMQFYITCQYGTDCRNCQYGTSYDTDCLMKDRNITDVLINMAENYLNGKVVSNVSCGSKNSERKIYISPLLNELEYRGIHVLNIETDPDSKLLDEESIGQRIVEDIPDTLDYILSREVPPTIHLKGNFVYKDFGIEYPLRNGKLTFTWCGSHSEGSEFINISKTEYNGDFTDDSTSGLIVSMVKILIEKGGFSEELSINASELRQKDGDLGKIILKNNYACFEGLIEGLDNLTSNMERVAENVRTPDVPQIILGEGDGMFALPAGTAASNYSYKSLYRLMAPNMVEKIDGDLSITLLQLYENPYRLRRSIDSPIDVDQFRTCVNKSPMTMARMGTLGIGYVLTMQQEWRPSGFALGTLLYSVALAPGEEQRLVMTERSEFFEVRDTELLKSDMTETYDSSQDSDSDSIFNRSLDEHAEGSTWMKSVTKGSSTGLIASIFASGSSSKTTGDSKTDQSASRDEASALAESFNETLSRQAQRKRESGRTGIRMATSEESSSVTSKIIANRNHSHALTMQYWEVVRNHIVSTRIGDVKMVCYIPFDLIPFLPSEQNSIISPSELLTTTNSNGATLKTFFYKRYETALKYYDSILSRIPYKYRNGFVLMKKYATYPDWDFQSSDCGSTTKLTLTVKGGMLSYQTIKARLQLKNGKGCVEGYLEKPLEKETHTANNKFNLVNYLEGQREIKNKNLKYTFTVPPGVRDDDFSHVTMTVSYPRAASYPVYRTAKEIESWEKTKDVQFYIFKEYMDDLVLTSRDFTDIGAPLITDVSLIRESDKKEFIKVVTNGETIQLNRVEEMYSTLTYPIYDDKPTMSFEELQQVESTFQHIVENSVRYSQAIWATLSAEERAMLFERYTIAMPFSAGSDVGNDIPLSNCIDNRIEGFYGNCMIVPFSLPSELAYEMNTSTKKIQDALFAYHADTFRSPEMMISLPAGGMVGEAILGGSNASEKIDITRFWKWDDSPIDAAPEISLDDIKDISLLEKAEAPDSLLALKQALTLGNKEATAMPDVAEEMTKEGAAFRNITNSKALSEHMTTVAKKSAEERMNMVSKSAVVAKAAIKVAAAAAGVPPAATAAAGSSGTQGKDNTSGTQTRNNAGTQGKDSASGTQVEGNATNAVSQTNTGGNNQ